jgi:hypothetical protein
LLLGLVACTQTTQVRSVAPYIARAERLRLSSGERVHVDRIVAQDIDSVVLASDQGSRRIALGDVVGVEHRDRWRGFRQGASAGLVAGWLTGVGVGALGHASCEETSARIGRAAYCELGGVFAVGVAGVAGMLVGGALGGGVGASVGHTDVYLRRSPVSVAPTREGVSALLTIEF